MVGITKTDQMRCDIILLRLKQLSTDHKNNSQVVGARTREKFQFLSESIDDLVKKLEKELAEVRWIDVK